MRDKVKLPIPKRSLWLTHAGMLAEQVLRAFWPFFSILVAVLAALMLGLQDQVRVEFLDHRFGEVFEDYEMLEGDVALFSELLEQAVNHQALVDQMTDRALVAKWPLGRIDSTLRALFRAAGAELTQTETPPKVVIVEFVQVAQAFFPEGKESNFVNAVLDHMAREAKPEAF